MHNVDWLTRKKYQILPSGVAKILSQTARQRQKFIIVAAKIYGHKTLEQQLNCKCYVTEKEPRKARISFRCHNDLGPYHNVIYFRRRNRRNRESSKTRPLSSPG